MSNPQVYAYVELANAQLDAAIDLYLSGNYLPAITLAGAAEELFGGPFAPEERDWRKDRRAHAQDARDFALVYREHWGEDHPRPFERVNQLKNALKHFDSTAASRTFDAEDEAFWMLDRAFRNRLLESPEHNLGRGDHPRWKEVASRHVELYNPRPAP